MRMQMMPDRDESNYWLIRASHTRESLSPSLFVHFLSLSTRFRFCYIYIPGERHWAYACMHACVHVYMYIYTHTMHGWMDGRLGGWVAGWLAAWMDGWMDVKHSQACTCAHCTCTSTQTSKRLNMQQRTSASLHVQAYWLTCRSITSMCASVSIHTVDGINPALPYLP